MFLYSGILLHSCDIPLVICDIIAVIDDIPFHVLTPGWVGPFVFSEQQPDFRINYQITEKP